MQNIPFIDLKSQYLKIKENVDSQILQVLDNCQYIMGPQVAECEKKLSAFSGAKHSLTCASGTDALVMALMALDIGPGDEVIVPGFSFFATAEAVSLVGARPIFVDIEADTYNIDVKKIAAAITKNTKAIMPVSLYGQVADMNEINAIAEKYKLSVIEDAAQSFGGTYQDKKSCNVSRIACTSFFPAKPLGCYGDGGAVFTNDDSLLEPLKQIRVHGQVERYQHERIGINGRMDTIQCVVVSNKLDIFQWEFDQRQQVAKKYNEVLAHLSGKIQLPVVRSDRQSIWAQYTISIEDRNKFAAFMQSKSVPTSIHYPSPLYKQKCYLEDYGDLKLENCEKAARDVISLPMHAFLKDETIDYIGKTVSAYFA